MIGQYLSNTNENATVSISQKFSELNKALVNSVSFVAKREMAASCGGGGHNTRELSSYRQTVEGEEPVHVVDGEVGCQWKKSIVLLHLMAMKN